jgi:hypothetical protein
VRPYAIFIKDVFYYLNLCLISLIPFTIIAFANVVLVWKHMAASRIAKSSLLISSYSSKAAERDRAALSVTLTAVVVSLTFIVLTLPTYLQLLINMEVVALPAIYCDEISMT